MPIVPDLSGVGPGAIASPHNPLRSEYAGWTAELANVVRPSDSATVQMVVDWFGGNPSVSEPPTGVYIGQNGFVYDIEEATPLSGDEGPPGPPGAGNISGPAVTTENYIPQWDTVDQVLKDGRAIGVATSTDIPDRAAADTRYPVLTGGKVDSSVLPSIAVTDVFVVASEVAMLALVAERGDVAIRTDLNKSYILSTDSPTTLADWKELLTPTDAVLSVAGLTGTISAAGLKTALAIAIADVASLQATLDAKEPLGEYSAINPQTGTTYEFVLTDKGKLVTGSNASPQTYTIPLNSSVAFPIKSKIDLVQLGAGQITIAATGGVTIRSSGSKLKLTGQYSGASLTKIGTDEWLLVGDIAT